MARLYIRFLKEQINYWQVGTDGACQQSGVAFHADQLPIFPQGIHTTLIVPGQWVTMMRVNLPKASPAQLKKAVPFMLEDQLIASSNTLHFVLSSQQRNGDLWVSLIEKKLLQDLLDKAKNLGLIVDEAVPDYLCVPEVKDGWHIYAEGRTVHVRLANQGFSIDDLQAAMAIDAFLLIEEKPASVFVDYDDGQEHTEFPIFEKYQIPITYAQKDTFSMALFVATLQQQKLISNLLQESFAPKGASLQNKHWLKWSAYIVGAWIIVALLFQTVEYFRLSNAVSTNQQQINTLYQQAFPNSKSMNNPQQRIQQQLDQTQKGNQRTQLLNWLYKVGTVLVPLNNNITIDNFNYASGRLVLSVTATNFQALDSLKNALTQQKLIVAQDNATTQASNVTARITISGETP